MELYVLVRLEQALCYIVGYGLSMVTNDNKALNSTVSNERLFEDLKCSTSKRTGKRLLRQKYSKMRYLGLSLCFGILLMYVLIRAQDLTQPKPGNCLLDRPCEGKGACIQEGDEYRCSCYQPYYESDNNECKEIDYCRKRPCTHGGTCKPIWGNYFCECPTHFHGQNCQLPNSAKISRISTPLVLFNLEATELNYTTVFLIFDDDIGTDFNFSISVHVNSGLILETQKVIEAVPAEVAQRTDLWSIPSFTTKFATVKKKLFYYTYFYPKQAEKQKTEVLRIEVKNGGVVQFAGNYTSNVTAPELWCIPDVTLYDCGETQNTAESIKRNTKIIIRSEIDSECTGSQITTSWRYYILTQKQPFPFPFSYSNMDQGKNREVLDKFNGQTSLEIEAHTLNYGDYIIELYVTETPLKPSIKMSHFNIVWGWIRIVPAHLEAHIVHGTEITVAKGSAIRLDASESHDPNEKNDKNKEHLVFSWTCEPAAELVCKNTNFAGNVVNIEKNLLDIGAYVFSVTVSVDPNWAATTGKPSRVIPGPSSFTQTVIVVDDKITHLGIECVKNCGKGNAVNIWDTVYLKAFCLHGCRGVDGHAFYRWTVVPKVNLNLHTTQFGDRSDKLIINPNVLQAGENYRITVNGGLQGMAAFALSTPAPLPLSNGTCALNPQTGITGVTKFNLTCHGFPLTQNGFSLQYELYQVDDPQDYPSGILISYTFHPSRHNILLMAGRSNLGHKVYLSFCVIDQYGISHKLHGIVSAEVKSFDENVEDHVEQLIGGPKGYLLEYLDISGKIPVIVELISAGVSALDSTTAKDLQREEILRDTFIEAAAKIPLKNSEAIMQTLSVLNLVLGRNETAVLSHNGVKNAANILLDIVEKMYQELFRPVPGARFSIADLEYFFGKVMDCSDTIIATTEKIMKEFPFPPEEPTTMTELQNKIAGVDYPDYTDINYTYVITKEDLQLASASVARGIRFAGKIATSYLKQEEKGKEIKSKNTTSYVRVEKPIELAGKLIPPHVTDGVKISTAMAEALQNKYMYVEIHVALTTRNPFAWDPESKDMNANLLVVYMRDQNTKEEINIQQFKEPLDMFVSLKDPTFLASSSHNMTANNVTVPLASIFKDEDLEQHITVHKIEGKRGTKPYMIFQNPPYTLMVVVASRIRPSIDDFRKYSEKIPHNVPPGDPQQESLVIHVQNTKDPTMHEKETFYIAILPEFETLEREVIHQGEDATLVVHYAFELFLISCPVWHTETMRWDINECEAGIKTSRGTLHCQCDHLSYFVGSVMVKPFENDPLRLVQLELKVENSIVVLVTVVLLYALFLLLFMWAHQQDKEDIPARALTILKDNIPGYRYPYLVIVFTDPRWNAGTTSNVFIEIVGANHKSEIHHLIDPRRKQTHTRGSDNWFAVHTVRWLGPLLYINLWHDNSGRNPSWCCEKILVHDVRRDAVWTFLVERWLSVVHDDESICCTVKPATKKEAEKLSSLFKEHLIMTIREDHHYLNAFLRHPRSTYTRKQRFAVSFFMTLGALMAGMWELGIPSSDNPGTQIQEEESDFVSIPHIFHALKCEVPIMAVCFTFTLLFRKTAPKEVDAMYKHGEKYEAILEEYKVMEITEKLMRDLKAEMEATGAQNTVTKGDNHTLDIDIIKEKIRSQVASGKLPAFQEETLQENVSSPEVDMTKDEAADDSDTVTSAAQVAEKLKKRPQIMLKILDIIMMEPFILSGLRIYSGRTKKSAQHFRLFQFRTDTFETSYYWFTYWLLYILWAAWVLIMAVFTYFLLYYGSLLGHVKSMEWMKCVVVSVVFGAFVGQTLKVLVFAAILTVFFRTHAKPSQLHTGVWWDETDLLHRMVLVDPKLTRAQYKPMFKAVSPEEIQIMREKQKTRMELRRLVIDLTMFFIYIATLYYVVLATRDRMAYYSTKTLEDHVIAPDKFDDIRTKNGLIDYLNLSLIPSLHCEKLYNGDPIHDEAIVSNYETMLLGVVRLRQLRVKADCTPAPQISSIFDRCGLKYSAENEDHNNYGISWKPFNASTFRETRARTPWLYKTALESGTTVDAGRLRIYPGGGYFATLGRTLNNSRAIFNFLVESSWFDHSTRAVFLDFTIYNVNRKLFNVVTVAIEVPVTGAVLFSYSVATEKLLITTGLLSLHMVLIITGWIIMFVLFFGVQLIRAWKESLIQFFMTPWNLMDLVIIALGVASIVMNVIRNYQVSRLIHHLEAVDGNEFIDFTWVGAWQIQLNYVMAALVALSTARLWRLLRFGNQFRVVEMTLFSSAKCLMFLNFMISILLLGFASLAYIFTGYKIFQFSSFELAFFYLLLYGFGFFHIRTVDIEEENSFVGRIFLLFYWLLYVIYLVNLFITVIIIYYENSKICISLKGIKLDVMAYIIEEITHMLGPKDEDEEVYDKERSLKSNSSKADSKFITQNATLEEGSEGLSDKRYLVQVVFTAVPKPSPFFLNRIQSIPVIHIKSMKALAQNFTDFNKEKLQIMKPIVTNELVEDYECKTPLYIEFFHCGVEKNKLQYVPDARLKEMEMLINGESDASMVRMQDYVAIIKEALDEEAVHLRYIEYQLDTILALLNHRPRPRYYKRDMEHKKHNFKPIAKKNEIPLPDSAQRGEVNKQDMVPEKQNPKEVAKKDEIPLSIQLPTKTETTVERVSEMPEKVNRENVFSKINLFLNKDIKAKIFVNSPNVKKQESSGIDLTRKDISHPASAVSLSNYPTVCPCSLCEIASKVSGHETS